ncbi:MAG: hypothetical protein JO033_26065 [Acidobacteriaceae bacterium]|nr:hypothetical protein [Acidobacteriaceae bacterium]MBV9498122.1 hypothetical protein [Acidobacteriaceae bacterium]
MASRWITTLFFFAGLIALASCGSRESPKTRQGDANTPAGKAGQAAHKLAVEADHAGRVVGRKLDKAAHDAKAGWDDAARKDQQKK